MSHRLTNNRSESVRLFVQGAAREDVVAYYWLAQFQRSEDSATSNCRQVCLYSRAAITMSIEQNENTRAYECYLANKAGCMFASYLMAVEMGSAEAANNLAFVFRERWDQNETFRPTRVVRLRDDHDSKCPLQSPTLQEDVKEAPLCRLRGYQNDDDAVEMRPWDALVMQRHFCELALKFHYFYSSLDVGVLALELAEVMHDSNATEVFRLYQIASQAGHG
jgi:hypothetical protein